MRQVVLDTETTGLEAKDGHRIIEIGCIEIVGRRMTDRRVHHYVNPERDCDEGALQVHGLTREFLADKPKFADVVDEVLAFVADAEVIIHNAPFDVEFLDAELTRLGRQPFSSCCAQVTDSLRLARELHPGKRNSLDVLCERYGISNQHRALHGALLDAGLLADVYLAMTRGQDSLVIDLEEGQTQIVVGALDLAKLLFVPASDDEVLAHNALLDGIEKESKGTAIWRQPATAAALMAAA